MKYLYLGKDTSIEIDNIIGIFDLDMTSISKHTRAFLAHAQKESRVVSVKEELPKSYILYDFDGEYSIYLSPLSSSTLFRRLFSEEKIGEITDKKQITE